MKIAIWGFDNRTVGQYDPDTAHSKGLAGFFFFGSYSILSFFVCVYLCLFIYILLTRSMIGSEESIVYCARLLAQNGYHVTVFANPAPTSTYTAENQNPRYLHHSLFPNGTYYDIVICWRRFDFHMAKESGKKVYGWYHDLPPAPQYAINTQNLDGVFYLTEFHKNLFFNWQSNFRKIPYTISGNGIVPSDFDLCNYFACQNKDDDEKNRLDETKLNLVFSFSSSSTTQTSSSTESDCFLPPFPEKDNNPFECVYISNWARGLETDLDIWDDIHKEFPQATLRIFYGDETWGNWSPEKLGRIKTRINELKSKGVTNEGMVGHLELAKALKRASILLYPCQTFAETFCIAVLKAQAAGCLLITTRIAALDETVHPHAFVVNHDSYSGTVKPQEYLELTLQTMRMIRDSQRDKEKAKQLLKYRHDNVVFASAFTWNRTVLKWLELHQTLTGDKIINHDANSKNPTPTSVITPETDLKVCKQKQEGTTKKNLAIPPTKQEEKITGVSKNAKKNKKKREKQKLKQIKNTL